MKEKSNSEAATQARILRSLPCDFDFEIRAREDGALLVSGSDEVGRGCIGGAVCCAAVILPPPEDFHVEGIRDSKMLTPKQRERLDAEIREHAIAWSIAEVSAEQIDKINIFQATKLAMTRAIKALNPQPDFLLIDSLKLPLPQRQLAITHGDVVSISIAAASIVAKVHRDHQMINEIDQQFPGYGFADHKGYGTPQHLKALFELGPCPIHRMSFRPVREAAAAKQDRLDKTKGAFAGA